MKNIFFACLLLSTSLFGNPFESLCFRMRMQLHNLPYQVALGLPPAICASSWYYERIIHQEYKKQKALTSTYHREEHESAYKELDRLKFKRTILRGVRNVSGVITAFGAGAYVITVGAFSVFGL